MEIFNKNVEKLYSLTLPLFVFVEDRLQHLCRACFARSSQKTGHFIFLSLFPPQIVLVMCNCCLFELVDQWSF